MRKHKAPMIKAFSAILLLCYLLSTAAFAMQPSAEASAPTKTDSRVHINTLEGTKQIILAETQRADSSYATVTAYTAQTEGNWVTVYRTTEGRVGSKGVTPIESRMQSTNKTPEGILKLISAYGIAEDPGAKYPYTKITNDMYWNLNNGSATYNQLVTSNPGGDSEHLIDYQTTYQYLFTTDYNEEQIMGKGGAIFLHCNGAGATSGCISVPESEMVRYMQWLEPESNPKLIVTTTADKGNYFLPQRATVTGFEVTDEGLRVSWSQADGAAIYVLQRARSSTSEYETIATVVGNGTTSYVDPNGRQTYYYRVITRNTIDGAVGYSVTGPGQNAGVPFIDIDETAYYYQPAIWAYSKGITKGTDDYHFSPDIVCTRAQIVTFLWRAAGTPEPTTSDHPFSDVTSDDYFYQAVLWAVEQGITVGTSETTFSPYAACTRGQVVTFLYRAAGTPAVDSVENPFTDVPPDSYYTNAVLWAVNEKITVGMSETDFVPDMNCTRGQIVTFLYRRYG